METAMADSTSLESRLIMRRADRSSVMLWAAVKAVMMGRTALNDGATTTSATRNAMWSYPERMCSMPSSTKRPAFARISLHLDRGDGGVCAVAGMVAVPPGSVTLGSPRAGIAVLATFVPILAVPGGTTVQTCDDDSNVNCIAGGEKSNTDLRASPVASDKYP